MDADPAAAPATPSPDLWAACEERAVVRLTLADGQTLTGHYTSRVGLHFLHRTGRDLPLIGEVSGPYQPGDVLAVEVVRTRAEVLADAYVRLHGERVPGPEPRTREEHEQRLQTLAGAVAAASDDWQRQVQVHRQFREAADRIGLAEGKRAWLLHAAARPPTLADLWVDAVASPSQRQTLRVSATWPVRARRTSTPTRRYGAGALPCRPMCGRTRSRSRMSSTPCAWRHSKPESLGSAILRMTPGTSKSTCRSKAAASS